MIHSYALSLYTTLVVSKNPKASTLAPARASEGQRACYVGLGSPAQPSPAAAATGQLPAAKTHKLLMSYLVYTHVPPGTGRAHALTILVYERVRQKEHTLGFLKTLYPIRE